jgi:predicted transposase YbfD/YdcC
VDGKALRGSGTAGGPGRHLLAALDHDHGVVLGQADVEAKTNEIPVFSTLLDRIDLAGAVVTADALHAQRAHAGYLVTQRGAHYLLTVEHASHCSCCLSWRVKQSSLAASDLDTQAFAASAGEVDGVELAALDLVQHGLAGDAEVAGGLAEGQPAVGCLGLDAVAELLVDADLPGGSGSELLAGDEAVAQLPVDGGAGDAELASGFGDADHGCILAAGCDILGCRLVSGNAVVGA